jgi:hypothetical protein
MEQPLLVVCCITHTDGAFSYLNEKLNDAEESLSRIALRLQIEVAQVVANLLLF